MFNLSTVEALKKKSQSILDVFTKTITDLGVVNAKISAEIGEREHQIAILTDENQELELQRTTNSNVMNKIRTFLSVE